LEMASISLQHTLDLKNLIHSSSFTPSNLKTKSKVGFHGTFPCTTKDALAFLFCIVCIFL